jgi:hypothetical protein
MATFTAYNTNHNAIARFDYGIVSLLNNVLEREKYNGDPIVLSSEDVPGIQLLLNKVEQDFNTAEIENPDPKHPWYHWSYQVKPGEKDFKDPLTNLLLYLSTQNKLVILED